MTTMGISTFGCIDAHTCGNPVRVVCSGAPELKGASMIEKRAYFLAEFDWVRTGLMLEPRGHEIMSGSILYPSTRDDCDVGVLFIEVSGCLPMCGHGAIGTVTVAIQEGLVEPKQSGIIKLDTPAGLIEAKYDLIDGYVDSVKITNVPSFVCNQGLKVTLPDLGMLTVDVAYGGNFYAIIESQSNYKDLDDVTMSQIQDLSPIIREQLNSEYRFVHPEHSDIAGLSHVMWTGRPKKPESHGRNAVFYGDKAIDRSPCGTGTSARMAQLAARGQLKPGDRFIHESLISSIFIGRFDETTTIGSIPAIVPSIEGWAKVYGHNVISIDDTDPYAHGFLIV